MTRAGGATDALYCTAMCRAAKCPWHISQAVRAQGDDRQIRYADLRNSAKCPVSRHGNGKKVYSR